MSLNALTRTLFLRLQESITGNAMIGTLLIFLLITDSHSTTSQENRDGPDLNNLYFLAGTLSDYMGRPTYVNKPNQVDHYYHYEKTLINYVDSISGLNPENEITLTFEKGRYETFSGKLSRELDAFYKDGIIDSSLFSTETEICSFLAGRYYRYGEQMNDSIYKIQLQNSPNHILIRTLLGRLGCKDIFYRKLKNVPVQFVYYFIAPAPLKAYFDKISEHKKILEIEYILAVRKSMGTDKDIDGLFMLSKDQALREVIRYFRNKSQKMRNL